MFSQPFTFSIREDIKAKPYKGFGWDRQKILTATPEVWQEFYKEWPSIPWETDVTEHARRAEEFLQKRLVEFFPKDRQKPRNSVFCDSTWALHRSKVRAKSALTQCKKTHELWQMAYGWAFLVGRSPQAARVHCLLNALRTCSRLQLYQHSCRLLHEHILQDRATMAEQLLAPLHRCPGKKAVQLLKPLRLGKRHSSMRRKSLPMVRHEDGSVVHSREEAVNRWRRHFSQIEGGITTDPDRLWHAYEASHTVPHDPCIDAADLPTVFELEHHLRRTALGKSCGSDGIPGEVLHASSSSLAHHLWPLLLKMTVRVQEPLQYKGEAHFPLQGERLTLGVLELQSHFGVIPFRQVPAQCVPISHCALPPGCCNTASVLRSTRRNGGHGGPHHPSRTGTSEI